MTNQVQASSEIAKQMQADRPSTDGHDEKKHRETGPGKDQELKGFLQPAQVHFLVAYNVLFALSFAALLIFMLARNAFTVLSTMLLTMLVAGTLGATLCNLRDLFTHVQRHRGSFPAGLKIPFHIRPLTGAITSLFTFFVGSLMVNSLAVDSAKRSWATFEGCLPYITNTIRQTPNAGGYRNESRSNFRHPR